MVSHRLAKPSNSNAVGVRFSHTPFWNSKSMQVVLKMQWDISYTKVACGTPALCCDSNIGYILEPT